MREFLLTHSRVRTGSGEDRRCWSQQAIDFANKLTGEPIDMDNRMTELSGGQTRALLIADATVICSTPVVLLDEVENAGIHRTRARAVAPRSTARSSSSSRTIRGSRCCPTSAS